MPGPLSEEEREEIIEEWESRKNPTYQAVSDDLGHHRDTVKKYVNEHYDDKEELPDDVGSTPAVGQGEDNDDSVFMEPGERLADDFKAFFEKLNSEGGFGIKDKAINMMVGEVKTHGQLPSPSDVSAFLESADSGISNSQELMWISRQYGLWVKQYQTSHQQAQPGGGMGMNQGGMFGQQAGGMFPQGQQGQPSPGQQGQPGMGMGQQQPAPGGGQGNQAMMMMFQQMQQQLEQLQQKVESGGGGGADDTIEEKTQEFLETKLEQLITADSTEEQEMVVNELRALRQEMQNGQRGGGSQLTGDWRQDVLSLARSGEIDMGEAKELLEEVGEVEQDPEYVDKKMEKEIRKMELEHEQDRYERIGEIFENVSEKVGEGFANRLVEGGGTPSEVAEADGGASQADTQPGASPSPDQPPTTTPSQETQQDGEECKYCGGTVIRQGNQAACGDCGFSVAPCDKCQFPVEVPPPGKAPYGECPECDAKLEHPDDDDADVSCGSCDWEGDGSEIGGEFIQCDNCEEYRPIVRPPEVETQQNRVEEILHTDPPGE